MGKRLGDATHPVKIPRAEFCHPSQGEKARAAYCVKILVGLMNRGWYSFFQDKNVLIWESG